MPVIQKDAFSTNDTIMASFHDYRYLMAPHIHQFAELVYVLDGEFTVISPGMREIARAGDIAIIHPFQSHGYFTDEGKKVKFWLLLFGGSIINDIIRDGYSQTRYERTVFTPSPELQAFIKKRMTDTKEEKLLLDKDGLRKIKSILYPVFDEYIANVSLIEDSEKIRSNSVSETLAYLSEHFKDNITIKDVSSAIGYSESHISHSLSDTLGMNFRTLLNSFRISHAKALLLEKNINIFIVSLECGFGSERSFHRAFLAATGMTPKEYRDVCLKKHQTQN